MHGSADTSASSTSHADVHIEIGNQKIKMADEKKVKDMFWKVCAI